MSKIEWTERTWNPVTGCSPVSPGCRNCYAVTMTHRLGSMASQQSKYRGLTVLNNAGRRHFSGEVRWHPDVLDEPLRRKKPTVYFTCSMADLFHPSVPFDFIDEVFARMALCRQHTFQVLTKRPERMSAYMAAAVDEDNLQEAMDRLTLRVEGEPFAYTQIDDGEWPWANVWLGTSAEDQQRLDERLPHLLACPAAVRFLSCEPLLGPVDLLANLSDYWALGDREGTPIDWVIVGGESGPEARPMGPDWVRSIRDQCANADVPFFFKQWGAWVSQEQFTDDLHREVDEAGYFGPGEPRLWRVGKKRAGRCLDGVIHDEMPGAELEDTQT